MTCVMAMEMFVEFIAREATSLVLKLKANRWFITWRREFLLKFIIS